MPALKIVRDAQIFLVALSNNLEKCTVYLPDITFSYLRLERSNTKLFLSPVQTY